MAKETIGHIDCPSCGTPKGMRITLDKNEHPFGYCEENCGQQLRVGPDKRRIKEFLRHNFPALGTVTVTVPAVPTEQPAPQPVQKPIQPAPATPPTPKPKQEKKPAPEQKAGWLTPLLGVNHG